MPALTRGPSDAFMDFVTRERGIFLAPVGSMGPSQKEVALYILGKASSLPSAAIPTPEKDASSVMGWLFDKLSRSNYAVAEFARDWAATGEPNIAALGAGFSGRKKTTYSDFLAELGMKEGAGRTALGLGLDIFADPLTYVPVAGLAAKVKAGKKTARLDELVPNKPLQERLLSRGEPLRPQEFGLPARLTQDIPRALRGPQFAEPIRIPTTAAVIPTPGFPQQALFPQPARGGLVVGPGKRTLADLPVSPVPMPPVGTGVGKAVGKPGQLPLSLGKGFNIAKLQKEARATKAENIVEGLAQGSASAAMKAASKPLPTPKLKLPVIQNTANDILSKFDPKKTKSELVAKHPDAISAKQQVALWYRSREAVQGKVFRKGRSPEKIEAETVANTINVFDQVLKGIGKTPMIGGAKNAEKVSLRDVAAELLAQGEKIDAKVLADFQTTIKPGTPLHDAVQAVRARSAVEEAPAVQKIAETASESKTILQASGLMSDNQLKGFEGFLKNFGKATAQAEGLSPAAQTATSGLIKEAIASGKSAAQIAVEQKKTMLDEMIATGKNRPEIQEAVTRALEKDLGKLPAWSVGDNKTVESVMGRLVTFWGQKELRPLTLNAEGSMQRVLRGFDQALTSMFKGIPPDDAKRALQVAKGFATPGANPAVGELATKIQGLMDNLVGHAKGQSVAFRSGVNMDRLNFWMDRHHAGFKFFKGKAKNPLTGNWDDLSQGTDWLQGWRYFDSTDTPQTFLTKMFTAVHSSTMERSVFDDMAARFGSRFKSKEYSVKITGHPYLDGYYWHPELAKEIPRFVRDWSTKPWSPSSDFGKFLDRGQSMWKSGVTIYRPAHHVRNQVGDMYLGWMDGVNTLRPYTLAARVQRHIGNYDTMVDVERLIEIGALGPRMGSPKVGEILFRNKSGTPFTADMVESIATQKGLLESARSLEDLIDTGAGGAHRLLQVKPLGGRAQKVARRASELQGHNARIAHLIDKLMKSTGSNIDEIAEAAAQRARKWHPTGLDLTLFEKKFLRRAMPFYAWSRKSLPLLLESLVMNPGKSVIPAKIFGSIQEMQGIETPGRQDPFPVDQMFPKWLRDQGLGPVATDEGFLGKITNQAIPGYVMGGMGLNPLSDLIAQTAKPGKSLLSMLTPGVQVPMEIMSGRKFYTEEPITGPEARPGALQQYIGENIPVWESFQDILGVTPFGTETKRVQKGMDQPNIERLINMLTAAGITGTGQYIPSARYEALQPGFTKQRLSREALVRALQEGSEG